MRTGTTGERISTLSTLVRPLAPSKNTLPPRKDISIPQNGLVARREKIPPEKLFLRIPNDSSQSNNPVKEGGIWLNCQRQSTPEKSVKLR